MMDEIIMNTIVDVMKNNTNTDMNLHTKKWKKFVIGDLFAITKGKRLIKDDQFPGKTPYVSSSMLNNGVTAFIDEAPLCDGNAITVNYNGSVGYSFYQDKPFFPSDSENVLVAKGWKMTPEIGVFISAIITFEKYRFTFGRSWKLGRFNKSEIWLPVNDEGNPDFEWIKSYMSTLPYGTILSHFGK